MEDLFKTAPLSHYHDLLKSEKQISVKLFKTEMAAVLQAYDYGIDNMTEEGKAALAQAITALKFEIHP